MNSAPRARLIQDGSVAPQKRRSTAANRHIVHHAPRLLAVVRAAVMRYSIEFCDSFGLRPGDLILDELCAPRI